MNTQDARSLTADAQEELCKRVVNAIVSQTPIGCNMVSTVTNQAHLSFMVFKQRFTSDVMIEFLRRLLRHVKRPVGLNCRRAPGPLQ
jgi:hypothetical protein